MRHLTSLPEPSADALRHSERLISQIRDEIDANGGSISFKRYMEMALYEPGLGYYVTGTHKLGAQGDFVTAPEISPLFSRCVANQCAEIIRKVGGCVLEFGAGSGIMATDILLELEQQNQLPEKYYILDLSPDLIQRQQQKLQKHAPHLLGGVEWLSSMPAEFNGIIIANEVLDAMPVTVFTQHDDNVYEHHVICKNNKLFEQLKPTDERLKKQVLSLKIPGDATPYTSELNPSIEAWVKTLSDSLKTGMILLIDYGYPRSEYYLPERNKGTLICHYQHLVNEAPLHYPGLQDITASVDFTAVAEATDSAGLKVAGFTSQAGFLANAGLEKYFMQALDNNPDDQYKLAQQVRILSLPSEMGERFKFIALCKNYEAELLGYSALDQRYRL
jgi:SAM-dependent MidA family methyltransferase